MTLASDRTKVLNRIADAELAQDAAVAEQTAARERDLEVQQAALADRLERAQAAAKAYAQGCETVEEAIRALGAGLWTMQKALPDLLAMPGSSVHWTWAGCCRRVAVRLANVLAGAAGADSFGKMRLFATRPGRNGESFSAAEKSALNRFFTTNGEAANGFQNPRTP